MQCRTSFASIFQKKEKNLFNFCLGDELFSLSFSFLNFVEKRKREVEKRQKMKKLCFFKHISEKHSGKMKKMLLI